MVNSTVYLNKTLSSPSFRSCDAFAKPAYSRAQKHCNTRVSQRQCTSEVVATTSTSISTDSNQTAADEPSTSTAQESGLELEAEVISSITKVSQAEWDACATAGSEVNPFLLWTFLHVLEESGSAVKEEGWLPQHVLVRRTDTQELLGAVPMYLKSHSYGEYVFDHSWASLYHRAGIRYYPKLQSCVPFTPVTGQRLLAKAGPQAPAVRRALAHTLVRVADELDVSSLHMTFNTAEEWEDMRQMGFLARSGIQYHWDNNGYTTFDDFLMDLKQSKRKNIRQERKKVVSAGVRLSKLRGDDIKSDHWDAFYRFYRNTVDQKWGSAYLTRDFFFSLGEQMGDNVVLVIADKGPGSKPIAGALNLLGSDCLYGRNWGCRRGLDIKHLHFEVCYYAAIELAIELGLKRVEAGAQGEHKIQRGYLPNMTYSSHYMRDPGAHDAIARFLRSERQQIDYTLEALTQEASPYKDR